MGKLIKILSFLFFLVTFLILSKSLLLNFYPDLSQYYFGAKSMNPYLNGIIYPPFSILIFSLLTYFPFVWIEKVWTILSSVSLFASVYLIFRLYNKKIFSILGFVALGLVCLSFPVKFTLGMGQINNFILLIFVSALYFLNKERNHLASFFLSLSLAIKLFPVYLLIYFFLAKKWKIILLLVIFLISLSLIAMVFVGLKINLYFYENFLPTLLSGWKTDYYNQSLTGFIGRSFLQNIFSQIIIGFTSLIFIFVSILTVFKSLKNKALMNMCFGLLITLNVVVNNFSWQHHFVFLIFPFLVTLFYILNLKKSLKPILIIFISYVLISFNLKNPSDVLILLQSHIFYGTVLLWFLEIYLIWRGSHKLPRGFSLALRH